MKFRIKIRLIDSKVERWESMEREIGQANYVRGAGRQPEFTGDIQKFGKDLIDWFNDGQPEGKGRREFITAEMEE